MALRQVSLSVRPRAPFPGFSLGHSNRVIDAMIGQDAVPSATRPLDERRFEEAEHLIDSMTPLERESPELFDGSRKHRIAGGAGQPARSLVKRKRR